MGNGKVVLLLVVWMAVSVGIGVPWGDDIVEDGKAKAEEAKKYGESAMHDAKEKSESLADWVDNKFSENWGEKDHIKLSAQNIKYKAEDDAASRTTESIKSSASGLEERRPLEAYDGDAEIIKLPTDKSKGAKAKVADTYEDAKHKMHYDTSHNAKECGKEKIIKDAKHKAGHVYDEASKDAKHRVKMASQKAYDAKKKVKGAAADAYDEAKEKMKMAGDKVNEATEHGWDKVAENFDKARQEVGDAFVSAKNTMSKEAKVRYEAAKEKASEATGNVGEKMRNIPEL